MPFGGTAAVRAMKDGDFVATIYPGTGAGLQAAIDSLGGGKGKVSIGPGTLSITTAISIHGGCHIQGSGKGSTLIQRAAGSLTTGDAAYSGNTFLVTPHGSNGTPPSGVGQAQVDILITDIALDGNSSAFGAVNPSTPRHMAVYATWASEMALRNVDIMNYLQTGVQFDTCRRVFMTDVLIDNPGQYASPSSRNGINFINNQNGLANDYAKYLMIENCLVKNPLDEGINLSNCRYVTLSNCQFINCDLVIELEGISSLSTQMGDFTFENVLATGNRGMFFKNGISSGVTLQNVFITNCSMEADAAAHITEAVSLGNDIDVPVTNFYLSQCSFRNCNSSNTSGKPMLILDTTSATTPCKNIHIARCTFQAGNPSSTLTNCNGIEITGMVDGLFISECDVLDAAGIGIRIDATRGTMKNIWVDRCYVRDCTERGLFIGSDTGAFTVSRVFVDKCVIQDPCEQTGSRAIDLVFSAASAVGGAIHLHGNLCVRTGANAITNGLRIFEGGSSTLDDITLSMNDFSGCTGAQITSSGTPTNIHMTVRPGRGADITAAATISIPMDGDVSHVTGNTNITNGITVNPWDNGRTVKLIFEGTPTVSDTGTSKLAGNFVAAGTTNDFDTLTLVCDGTNWYEVARSVN